MLNFHNATRACFILMRDLFLYVGRDGGDAGVGIVLWAHTSSCVVSEIILLYEESNIERSSANALVFTVNPLVNKKI